MIRTLAPLAALMLAACVTNQPDGPASPYEIQQQVAEDGGIAEAEDAPEKLESTTVFDQSALDRLRNNSGLTLQWIGWEDRGTLTVTQPGRIVYLKGRQTGTPQRPGTLTLDGAVVAIDTDTFTFDGTIHIRNTPDPGRDCLREGPMTFAVTQNRKYWRLQDMTACGGLTDYVDIYF